ncbi:MAG: RNB domain-containing ribonuclease [Bacteroidota bacterium]|nr:ribonuclease II [Odoribacter sp.]MDP3642444.1 RNB domain-containing ribonuclease [Bacteroidota bacterium]
MNQNANRITLQQIARRAMISRGLAPDFPTELLEELKEINIPATNKSDGAKDMRGLQWCSVDNDDSLDLDQLTYAEQLPGNKVRLLVAIADVDALVPKQSNIDKYASQNTATIYTVAQIFPMLPEKLSTDFTSMRLGADRCAVVVEMIVDDDGAVQQSEVYRTTVCNHAKLQYESLGDWLEENGPIPSEILTVEGLAENIQLQDRIAQKMKELRYEHGALEFKTIEARPVFDGDALSEIKAELKNRAKSLIEDFMIAANGATARYLAEKSFPSLRRVVRTPKRWDRIVELASERGFSLPEKADSKSLSAYLKFIRQNDPDHFVDMSLSVLKLLGPGEYVVEIPGSTPEGHFGLAVKDYTHSTAPNRRFPDLVTQRLLKSAMAGHSVPYSVEQLEEIARHCTVKEDDARKVERQVEKSAMAMLMKSRIGEVFEAIVTGASPKGTWIRLYHPHVEGKLENGFRDLEVGNKLKARLIQIDVEEGFIDFERTE